MPLWDHQLLEPYTLQFWEVFFFCLWSKEDRFSCSQTRSCQRCEPVTPSNRKWGKNLMIPSEGNECQLMVKSELFANLGGTCDANVSLFWDEGFIFIFLRLRQTGWSYLLQNSRRPQLRPHDTLGRENPSHAPHFQRVCLTSSCREIQTVPLWQQTPLTAWTRCLTPSNTFPLATCLNE